MSKQPQSIMHSVRNWSRSRPKAVALEDGSTTVTYEELLHDVDELLLVLQETSLPRQSRVAVCTSDRRAMITSLLALFDADLTFAPVPIGAKPGHLERQLDAVQPSILLVGKGVPADLTRAQSPSARRLAPTAPHELAIVPTSYSVAEYPVANQQANAAYLMLSSGSTGIPKAILGSKAGVEHFIEWETSYVRDDRSPIRGSQLTKPTFDAFYRDVFVPLCSGGTIVVPPFPDRLWDPALLVEWIREKNITLLHCVPTLLREILSATDRPGSMGGIAHAFVAGEPLRPSDARLWFESSAPTANLINLYGATETVMTKFYHPVRPEDASGSYVPIGKPMPGVFAHLATGDAGAASSYESGELFIDVPFLCGGYFGNDILTDSVFSQSPLGTDRSLFRTGDIARVDADGNYELLGRMDRQVKVRGIRLELDAVEAAISDTGMVQECAVIENSDMQDAGRLTAFILLKPGTSIETLQSRLRTILEDHAVPSEFVSVERMPRTASGKLSRNDLIAIQSQNAPHPMAHFDSPVAESLALVWRSFLKEADIRRDSDFFSLGGNSLSAAQMLMRIRKQFGLNISLAEFFEATRLDALSQLFMRKLSPSPLSPNISQNERSPFPSAAQEWMLARQHLHPSYYGYRTVRIINLDGPLSSNQIISGLEMLVERHEALRSHFSYSEGQWYVSYPTDARVPCSILDVTFVSENAIPLLIEQLVEQIAKAPYRGGPSDHFCPTLLRVSDNRHCLVLVLHHLVADAWSLGILWQEFSEFVLSGQRPALPPRQISHYIAWQRSILEDSNVLQELDRLGSDLQSATPSVIPPDDQNDRDLHPAHEVTLDIVGSDYACIQDVCRSEGITPFMYFLSVYSLVLAFKSHTRTVFVPSVFRNRSSSESREIVGWLANRALFRVEIDPNTPINMFLKQVRKTVLHTYAREAIPFEQVSAHANIGWQAAASHFNSHFGFHYDEVLAPSIGKDSLRIEWSPGPNRNYIMDRNMNTHVADRSRSYRIRTIYAADLYHEMTIRNFLRDIRSTALIIPNRLDGPIHALSASDINSLSDGLFEVKR